MDTICRLCATKSPFLTPLFSLKNSRVISDMIIIICPVKLDFNDNLPQSVCQSCIKTVYDAVELREKSIQNDQNFRSGCFELETSHEVVKIKQEVDPFNQELWIDDENQDSSSDDDQYENFQVEQKTTHRCQHCGIEFPKFAQLTRHISELHSDNPEKSSCSTCGFQLAHATNVKRHMKRYHDPNLPFGCNLCTFRFMSESKLYQHFIKVHDESIAKRHKPNKEPQVPQAGTKHESILCDFCGKNFTNRTLLERHLTMAHRPKDPNSKTADSDFTVGSYPCEKCDKTFTMRHNLHRHMRRLHSEDLQHECKLCSDRFKSEILLNRHVIREHENLKGMFNKIAADDGEEEQAVGENEIHEQCHYCDQEFNGSKYRYERHMVSVHPGELARTYDCDVCPKKFVFLKSLRYHVEVHRKRAREQFFKFKCDLCCRKFLSEKNYKHHVTFSHAESSTFVCSLCGQTLDTRKKFNYHMLRHQNIRHFQCKICEKKFFLEKHLNKHLAVHSDARPYVCTYNGCGKSYKFSDVLKKHVRTAHQVDGAGNLEAGDEKMGIL